MFTQILKNRSWKLKLSIKKRVCYISGESLCFKFSYRGRKYISTFLNGHKPIVDDIWLSKKQFLSNYSRNKII